MGIGDNIRKLRASRKLSQEYLAEQLGISRQAVSRWETGQTEPTARNLVELAGILSLYCGADVPGSLRDGIQPIPASGEGAA